MGGIIVVDFIDMCNAENRKKLYNHLSDEMKDDKAKHKILPPSKFGLIQITRQWLFRSDGATCFGQTVPL
ncbi:ribonuclease G [Gelidibacter algens]|uniref:Ribonuclease G n=1 Tax=Gelidibacter algens TaxID=49280 RepID=A0A327SE86_9FLAO|nr:ribonuclease G [Gelidibacter algens]